MHGPLLALLWLRFRAVTAHAVVAEFDYCLMRPVFVGAIVVTPGVGGRIHEPRLGGRVYLVIAALRDLIAS